MLPNFFRLDHKYFKLIFYHTDFLSIIGAFYQRLQKMFTTSTLDSVLNSTSLFGCLVEQHPKPGMKTYIQLLGLLLQISTKLFKQL